MYPSAELYFEDFVAGEVVTYGDKRLETEELLAFSREFDPQPFHLSEEAGKGTFAGGLIASGWQTNVILHRINCDAFLNRAAGIGSPGIDEVKWLRPVRPGDRFRVRRTIAEVMPSRSKPDRGSVRFFYDLLNQDDEHVCHHNCLVMFLRRAPLAEAEGAEAAGADRAAKPTETAATSETMPLSAGANDSASALMPFFEDLELGWHRRLGEYRFTAENIDRFARAHDNQGFHVDPAIAAAGPYGGIIASGFHTGAAWMATMVRDMQERMAMAQNAGSPVPKLGVSPGVRLLRWLRPVRPGDTLTYHSRIVEKRASASRPGWGLVFQENWAENQQKIRVFSFIGAVFWASRQP